MRIQQNQVQLTLASDTPGIGRAGEVVTFVANPAQTSDQLAELDTYLGGYRNWGMVADEVSPIVLVDREKGKRRDHSLANAFEEVRTETGRQGAINEIEHLSSTADYETVEHALGAFVPFASENEAVAVYDVRMSHSRMISNKLALAREIRVATSLTTTANWNSANHTTLTTNFKWNGGSTADPRADLHARIKASAQPVTHIVMNPDVAFYLLSDEGVRSFMKQFYGDTAPSPDVARGADAQGVVRFSLPGMPPVVVAPGKKKNATTGALEYIWPNDVVLISTPPGAGGVDPESIATHLTFRTRGRSGTGFTTNEYVPYGRGLEGGTMLESGYKETSFFPSAQCGGLIKSVLA